MQNPCSNFKGALINNNEIKKCFFTFIRDKNSQHNLFLIFFLFMYKELGRICVRFSFDFICFLV